MDIFTLENKKSMNPFLDITLRSLAVYFFMILGLKLFGKNQLSQLNAGDMSIIGPRPLLVNYLPLYSEIQRKRHLVRPGITGWAQVNGRNAISWEQKFNLDVWYVANQSFLLDLKIFFLTIRNVVKASGVSQEGQATMEAFTGTKE